MLTYTRAGLILADAQRILAVEKYLRTPVGWFTGMEAKNWRLRHILDLNVELTAGFFFVDPYQRGLKAMVTGFAGHGDGQFWLHASISRPGTMPDYHDLVRLKRDFIGEDRKAIQVFAPKGEHYSEHDYCLHLWAPLDRDPLPDFRIGGQI